MENSNESIYFKLNKINMNKILISPFHERWHTKGQNINSNLFNIYKIIFLVCENCIK